MTRMDLQPSGSKSPRFWAGGASELGAVPLVVNLQHLDLLCVKSASLPRPVFHFPLSRTLVSHVGLCPTSSGPEGRWVSLPHGVGW